MVLTDLQQVKSIDTDVPSRIRSNSDETPQSVIHAPKDFKEFVGVAIFDEPAVELLWTNIKPQNEENRPPSAQWSTPSPIQRSDFAILPSDAAKTEAIVSTKVSRDIRMTPLMTSTGAFTNATIDIPT